MTTQNSIEKHEKLHFIKPKEKFNANNIEEWSKKEIKSNSRARSAKLRSAVKT